MTGHLLSTLNALTSQRIAVVGLGLVTLHLALIIRVTGNLDQLVLSLLFWGVIMAQVCRSFPLQMARSPLARVVGIAVMAALCLKSLQSPETGTAFVRLFPVLAFAGWSLWVRREITRCEGQLWVLVVALSVPPRALPLILETILGQPIRVATAAIAAFGLHLIGFDVVQQGSLIQLPGGTVDVEFACTGAALLSLLLQVSVLLAVVTEWTKLNDLVGWSVAIAALLSTVRVAIMAAVAGNEAAFQFWHGSSGGQLFTLIALAILSYKGSTKDRRFDASGCDPSS